jgi:hypothetical protein
MLQDAVGTEWEIWTRQSLVDGRATLDRGWSPDVGSLQRWDRVPDGWRGTTDHGPWQTMAEKRETHWLDVELGEDGSVRIFCGRGSDNRSDGARVIIELIIGGLVRRGVEAAAAVAHTTGYQGRWDIGLAVNNLGGAVSYFRHDNWWVEAGDLPPYRDATYRRTWSGTTSELLEDLDGVVERLVGPLNRTLTEGRFKLPGLPRISEPEPLTD